MIEVNCPYCGKEFLLRPDEMQKLIVGHKCTITCERCEKDYELKFDAHSLFESKIGYPNGIKNQMKGIRK